MELDITFEGATRMLALPVHGRIVFQTETR